MNADFDPTSIDLARESDFSAGDLKVRPSLRQVESEAGAETLEPRVMQVLVALFQRRGDVVSRDELIQRCWGGRAVGEDAISRAIARVRKLGESTGAFNLETIPKVGYRMMGVTPADVPDAATPLSPGRWAQIARSPLASNEYTLPVRSLNIISETSLPVAVSQIPIRVLYIKIAASRVPSRENFGPNMLRAVSSNVRSGSPSLTK